MFFYMPVQVFSERNCIAAHGKELAALGKKALIVTGKSSAEKNGSLADVRDALAAEGCGFVHFNGVEENPSVETVMQARDLGVNENVDFVIGIGGGSPMDAAKAIAVMIREKDKDASLLFDASVTPSHLPIALIPTTCGTGSEVTGISVLTRHDLHTKVSMVHKVFADLALIDGKYMKDMPAHIFAETTMDAFAHLTESFVNAKASDLSRMCVDAGLKLWLRSKDVILGKRQADEKDYLNMLNASAMAGMSIALTGTALPHGLSYALTYNTRMPHGKACGYFLPAYLEEAKDADRDYILETAHFSSTDDLALYYDTTCGRDKVDVSVLELSVEDLLKNPAKMASAPFATNETVLRRIAGI